MIAVDKALVKQWEALQEAEAAARKLWDKKDRELRKLIRLSKLGRKSKIVVPISENRGIRITDLWRSAMRDKETKIFTKAYCHRHEVKEVPLEAAD